MSVTERTTHATSCTACSKILERAINPAGGLSMPECGMLGSSPAGNPRTCRKRDDEWTIKRRLISVSKGFPTYMTELALSTDELFWIASEAVPDDVRDVLLTELETFAPKLGPKGAAALANWAAAQACTPTADAIVTMATKGGSGSARPIIKLLGAEATTIDLELIKGALNALGKPYSQLTTPGWERPKVDVFDGVAAVLTRLQEADIVSKFEENTEKHVFEVSKRHS